METLVSRSRTVSKLSKSYREEEFHQTAPQPVQRFVAFSCVLSGVNKAAVFGGVYRDFYVWIKIKTYFSYYFGVRVRLLQPKRMSQ